MESKLYNLVKRTAYKQQKKRIENQKRKSQELSQLNNLNWKYFIYNPTNMKIKFKENPKTNPFLRKSFNISEERSQELLNSSGENLEDDPSLIEALPRMLKECTSIEEYSYVCVCIGGWGAFKNYLAKPPKPKDKYTYIPLWILLGYALSYIARLIIAF